MDYAKLPTDNLYKFLTVLGAGIVVASVFLPRNEVRELQAQMFATEDRLTELAVDIEHWTNRNKRFQSRLEQIPSLETLDESQRELKLKEILESQDILDSSRFEIKKAMALQGVQVQRFDKLNARREAEFQLAQRYAAIGSIIAVCGFCLWRSKVQVFHDKILRKQATDKE